MGSRGMLGHVVERYLSEAGLITYTVSQRFERGKESAYFEELLSQAPDWVINCIGVKSGHSPEVMQLANVDIVKACTRFLPRPVQLIHASSDAVFRPDKPVRNWHEQPDAEDPYGLSKLLAETAINGSKSYIIRTSIIGPEVQTNRSLMNWLVGTKGEITGYIDQAWNGITTLEWASLCSRIIYGDPVVSQLRIVQPATWPPITKYDLLMLIAQYWGLSVKIVGAASGHPIMRSLMPNVDAPSLKNQLRSLRSWYGVQPPCERLDESAT